MSDCRCRSRRLGESAWPLTDRVYTHLLQSFHEKPTFVNTIAVIKKPGHLRNLVFRSQLQMGSAIRLQQDFDVQLQAMQFSLDTD
jgi:hypothetical protein